MSKMHTRFIADLHLEHKNIWKYRPVFKNTKHNDLYFLEVLKTFTTKRDQTFFLGDIVFGTKYLQELKELPGTKIKVLGNHDTEHVNIKDLANTFDSVHGMMKYKEFWLSHAPIHPDELRSKKNIHGHVHTETVQDPMYLNVSVESSFVGYKPRTIEEVRAAFSTGKIYHGLDEVHSMEVIENDPVLYDIYNRALKQSKQTTFILGK